VRIYAWHDPDIELAPKFEIILLASKLQLSITRRRVADPTGNDFAGIAVICPVVPQLGAAISNHSRMTASSWCNLRPHGALTGTRSNDVSRGLYVSNETRSKREDTPPCSRCGAPMQPIAHVPAFAGQPGLDAFECKCGHVESFIRVSDR